MKRLIKKAFGVTLFHGTSIENLKSITEAGMIAPQETEGGGLGPTIFDAIQERAKEKVEEHRDEIEDERDYNSFLKYYIEEETKKEETKFQGYTFFAGTLEQAQNYCMEFPFVVIEVALPEDSLMPDDNDCPSCKTWKESLDRVEQVKVLGTITSDYIVGVHIIKDYGEEEVFYPKLTWENEFIE